MTMKCTGKAQELDKWYDNFGSKIKIHEGQHHAVGFILIAPFIIKISRTCPNNLLSPSIQSTLVGSINSGCSGPIFKENIANYVSIIIFGGVQENSAGVHVFQTHFLGTFILF